AREAIQRMYEGGSDDDDLDNEFEWDGNEDDDFDGGEEDDDDVDDLENEYLKHLAGKASKALGGSGNADIEDSIGSDDEDDDEYDEDALDEEYSLETPLDHIDAYLVLQDRLTEMQVLNTGTYNAIMQSLSTESGQFLRSLIDEADKKRNSQAGGNSQQ
ncbi:hypothetical protein GGI09_009251, partial [Coemansia sp. S100]